MEHDRREESHDQPVAAQAEPKYREEPAQPVTEQDFARDQENFHRGEREPREEREDFRENEEPSQSGPEPDRNREPVNPEIGSTAQPGQGQARGRGRGRGRGRRLSPRDRRMQERNRRRESRPHYHGHGSEGAPEDLRDRESRAESPLPPEKRSLLEQARMELDQVRDVLEGVLKDLDNVAELLTKAEHEKDLSEAEIEQLRESLRRLHR